MGGRGSLSKFMDMTNEERKQERKNLNDKLKEFDELPSDTHHYDGSGQEQVDFFDKYSNYNELINKMTDSEKSEFDDIWVPGDFMFGEGYKNWNEMGSWAKRAIKVYDKYLDQSVLKRGVVVTRLASAELLLGKGNKFPTSIDELKALEGKIVVSTGNMSTAAAKQGLTIGSPLTTHPSGIYENSRGKSMEYRIHIPSGTKGAGMWIGDKRINSYFGRRQREFMTNRDIRLRVGKTRYDASRDVYVTDLIYAGRLDHRYS